MKLSFAINHTVQLRSVQDPKLLSFIRRARPAWRGGRLEISFGKTAPWTKQRYSNPGPAYSINLKTGDTSEYEWKTSTEPAYRYGQTENTIDVESGSMVLTMNRFRSYGEPISLEGRINEFAIGATDSAILDVARDAILAGDEPTGTRLAREALPEGFPLFVHIIKRERAQIYSRSMQDAYRKHA